jgi:hypothetical protein
MRDTRRTFGGGDRGAKLFPAVARERTRFRRGLIRIDAPSRVQTISHSQTSSIAEAHAQRHRPLDQIGVLKTSNRT